MQNLVVDANVIIAVLRSGNTEIIKILQNNKVYAPDYLLFELGKYKDVILKKYQDKYKIKILRELIKEIFEELTILPSFYISKGIKRQAEELVKDIDEKDAPYVALTLAIKGAELITRDEKLIKNLKNKIKIKHLTEIINQSQK